MNLTDKIQVFNMDCMEAMSAFPDKFFDLAIVDIPYGKNVCKMSFCRELSTTVKQKNGTRVNANRNKQPYSKKQWDNQTPSQQYFDELIRVSNHQIVFGIDYTDWDKGSGRIKWDKGFSNKVSFNRYETAYCSLIHNEVELPLLWAGMMQAKSLLEPMIQQGNKRLNEKRIHPTHKPVMLYSKLLSDYAHPGYKILDTHLGSGSSAIAANNFGCEFWGYELDQDYFEAMVKRFKEQTSQLRISV